MVGNPKFILYEFFIFHIFFIFRNVLTIFQLKKN